MAGLTVIEDNLCVMARSEIARETKKIWSRLDTWQEYENIFDV